MGARDHRAHWRRRGPCCGILRAATPTAVRNCQVDPILELAKYLADGELAREVCREAMEVRQADPWEPVYEVDPGFYVTRMSCLISVRGAGYPTCALHRMRDTISRTGAPFGRKRSAPCLKAAIR